MLRCWIWIWSFEMGSGMKILRREKYKQELLHQYPGGSWVWMRWRCRWERIPWHQVPRIWDTTSVLQQIMSTWFFASKIRPRSRSAFGVSPSSTLWRRIQWQACWRTKNGTLRKKTLLPHSHLVSRMHGGRTDMSEGSEITQWQRPAPYHREY